MKNYFISVKFKNINVSSENINFKQSYAIIDVRHSTCDYQNKLLLKSCQPVFKNHMG